MRNDESRFLPPEVDERPQREPTYAQWAYENPDADFDLRRQFAETDICRDVVIEGIDGVTKFHSSLGGSGITALETGAFGTSIMFAFCRWVAGKWGADYNKIPDLKPITRAVPQCNPALVETK